MRTLRRSSRSSRGNQMTFSVIPFGCPRHYGHQTMGKHHHSQGSPRTSSFWVPVWRRQLFGQEPHMHGFRVCLVRVLVELPSFTGGTFQLYDPHALWLMNFQSFKHFALLPNLPPFCRYHQVVVVTL